jgi:soluble lytic murein transglycosylase
MMFAVIKHRLFFTLVGGSLLLGALACAAPEGIPLFATPTPSITPSPTSSPTPTATATPTQTPTPIPRERLDSAGTARFYGDWDRAEALYLETLAQAVEPQEIIEAKIGLGRTYIEAGRLDDAEAVLSEVIGAYPDDPQVARAYFFRGSVNEALENHLASVADFENYLRLQPGKLDELVHQYRGNAFMAAGDYPAAIEAYQTAIDYGGGLWYLVAIGNAHVAMGERPTALGIYQQVYESTDNDYLKAEMDLRMGWAYAWLGQTESAYLRYQDAVENFPLSYDSYLSLVELVEAGVPVDELQRAMVDYYAGQYEVAVAAFNRYLDADPEHDGTGHYYKALALRNLGNPLAAVAEWGVLIDDHPGDQYWVDAWEDQAYTLWAYMGQHIAAMEGLLSFVANYPDHPAASAQLLEAAKIAERNSDLIQAGQLLDRVVDEYPQGEHAFPASFQSGITQFRLGNLAAARERFARALEHAGGTDERAAAYLWIGKSAHAEGDESAARAAWDAGQLASPNGYYGIRSAELREGEAPFTSAGVFDFSGDRQASKEQAESWLRETFGITSPGPLDELDDRLALDARLIRGRELWDLGMLEQARTEFETLQSEVSEDPLLTYQLMHYLAELGLYKPAIYASLDLLRMAGLADVPSAEAPRYISGFRYAPYFGDLILPAALERGLDGLFLLSLVRQESLFESFATSYAEARGLMQIIPSTGQELAQREGWPPDYTDDDLYRPNVSVRLGSRYLADLVTLFEGDLYAALAGYNAGPGNSLAWKEASHGDPDLFLEIVRLQQPQDYIRAIYWAYHQYQDLYVTD